MADIENFQEWFDKRNRSEKEEEAKQGFTMHLNQAMAGFDGVVAQLILLRCPREIVLEMVNACYSYWVRRTNLEEEDGPDHAS